MTYIVTYSSWLTRIHTYTHTHTHTFVIMYLLIDSIGNVLCLWIGLCTSLSKYHVIYLHLTWDSNSLSYVPCPVSSFHLCEEFRIQYLETTVKLNIRMLKRNCSVYAWIFNSFNIDLNHFQVCYCFFFLAYDWLSSRAEILTKDEFSICVKIHISYSVRPSFNIKLGFPTRFLILVLSELKVRILIDTFVLAVLSFILLFVVTFSLLNKTSK